MPRLVIAEKKDDVGAERIGPRHDALQPLQADMRLAHVKVGEDRDGAAGIGLDLPDDVVTRLLFGMGAVAHVQAKDIGARLEQGADRVVVA